MSWTEWTSVIKLSQMWGMKPVYDLAIRKVATRIQNSDEWIAALKMSTQLRIRDFREIAIEKLADQLTSALQKIELGIEYKIQSWLLEGYMEFVERNEVISVEDEAQLGWSRTSNLFRVRHRRLQASHQAYFYNHDVQTDVQDTFAEEFADTAESEIVWSPISHLRPELYTATDPGVIQRDEEYYCVEIIFSVRKFRWFSVDSVTHLASGRRQFIQAASLFVRGKLGRIPRHVFPPCSRRHLV
jgi:hypothetical protein